MIIALTIIMSFFSYSQFVINGISKIKISPFIFFITLFGIWELISLIMYGSGISYLLLSFFYQFTFYIVTIIYAIFLFWNFRKVKFNFKDLILVLKYSPIFFILVSISIFFLFFHKTILPSQSDYLYYYKIMNIFSLKKYYELPSFNDGSAILYSNVGFYQYGTTLNIFNRLLLMPYFTMFIYFYITITSLFFVLDHFIKRKLLCSIATIIFLIMMLFFYIFANTNVGYVIMVGNIESAYLLSLLIIPSFLNTKNKWNKIEFQITFFAYLFYNETAILVTCLYVFCYLFVNWFRRKKNNFIPKLFVNDILILLISFYLLLCDFLVIKFDNNHSIINFAFKFIPIFLLIVILLSIINILFFNVIINVKLFGIILKDNKFFKKNFWINSKKNSKIFNKIKSFNWFQIHIYEYLKWMMIPIIIVIFFLAVYSTDLGSFIRFKSAANDFYYYLIWFGFSIIFSRIIVKGKQNNFFYFFLLLVVLSTILGWIFNDTIASRFYYSNVYMTYGIAGLIHDFVLAITFLFISMDISKINRSWKDKLSFILFWKNNKNKKIYKKQIINLLTTTTYVSLTIVPLAIEGSYFYNPTIKLEFKNINDNFYGGLSKNTINQISTFDFHDMLTFSDIPLPIFNSTSRFNISHAFYGLYWTPSYFWNRIISYPPFKNLDGKLLNKIDSLVYTNDILPYYNYFVIRPDDKYFLPLIEKIKDITLVKNYNNQILIFKNNDVNISLQEQYLKYNNSEF